MSADGVDHQAVEEFVGGADGQLVIGKSVEPTQRCDHDSPSSESNQVRPVRDVEMSACYHGRDGNEGGGK